MKKIISIVLTLLILASCAPQETEIPVLPGTPTVAATPLFTPTAVTRTLTVCLGEEPNTLYPFGNLNAAARSVLSAMFDGPMDVVEYEYEPIILEKIPNIEDGDAQVNSITVRAGDQIVDADGNVVLLATGTKLRPFGCREEGCEITYDGTSELQMDQIVDADGNVVLLATGTKLRPFGCREEGCEITYDGTSELQMDQMVVTFTMLGGLMWSDGEPLTAADSVYSFEVASSDDTPGSKFVIDRTQTYEAADEVTTQWWGMPGFIDPDYVTNFWIPLPQHLWGESSPADLTRLDASARLPVGWGPYILTEWIDGESLHLIKNLNYFRASSNLPHFDELTFLIMPDANAALTALVDGSCDVLDPSVRLDGQVGLLQQMQADDQADIFTAQTMTMEWLGIGITPASYDNGYNTTTQKDRPDFFRDRRMRQALALCLDRQKVVDTVLFGLSQVPDSYLPSDHALHNGNLQTYAFNPEAGSEILEQVGWIDGDNNPATPRLSVGVTNVPGGTPLILNYQTSSATQRRQVAEIFTESLAQCGIGLNPVYSTASDFYAQGPQGPLFGRQFDLAAYAIGVNSLEPQCSWFISSQIPSDANAWIGTNVSGYKNPAFDSACGKALESLPGEPGYTSHQEAQSIFASELPSIPLYLRLKVAAARPDFCGFTLDPSSSSSLADIETFDYGTSCRP